MNRKFTKLLFLATVALLAASCGGNKTEDRGDLTRFELSGSVRNVGEKSFDAKISNGKLTVGKKVMSVAFEVRGYDVNATFDEQGRLTCAMSKNSGGNGYELYSRDFDEDGLMTSSIDITYYGSASAYGRSKEKQEVASGSYYYDKESRLICDSVFVGVADEELKFSRQYIYNKQNLLEEERVYMADGNDDNYQILRYEYDAEGLMIKRIEARMYNASYDQSSLEQYVYDKNGREIEKNITYPSNDEPLIIETKLYNKQGLLEEKKLVDNQGIDLIEKCWKYKYRKDGKLEEVGLTQTFFEKELRELYLAEGGIDKIVASEGFDINDYINIYEVDSYGNWTKRVNSYFGKVNVTTREYKYY